MSGGGLKYTSKVFSDPKPGVGTYKAGCPKGTHVYGGGHYNAGGFFDLEALHSYPFDGGDSGAKPDDGWAAQLGVREPHPVTIYAICAKPMPEYAKSMFTMNAGPTGLLTGAQCGPGLNVISGGTRGDSEVAEEKSYPGSSSIWSVAVSNTQSFYESSRLHTLAVCADLDVEYRSGSNNVPPQTQGQQLVTCPDGTYVAGGGQQHDGDDDETWVAASRPNRPGEPDSGWQSWIDNREVSEPTSLTTHAICVAPLNGP